MSIPREELYTYRVEWSEEDQEFVGTVAEFPSLSCLADSSLDALSGIQQVVLQAIDILEEEGKLVPEPYRLRQEPPMHTRGRLIPGVKGSVVSHDALCTWRRISAIVSSAVMS